MVALSRFLAGVATLITFNTSIVFSHPIPEKHPSPDSSALASNLISGLKAAQSSAKITADNLPKEVYPVDELKHKNLSRELLFEKDLKAIVSAADNIDLTITKIAVYDAKNIIAAYLDFQASFHDMKEIYAFEYYSVDRKDEVSKLMGRYQGWLKSLDKKVMDIFDITFPPKRSGKLDEERTERRFTLRQAVWNMENDIQILRDEYCRGNKKFLHFKWGHCKDGT